MRGLIAQILLPAFFITVAMPVALAAPGFADPPPIILSTAMLSHLNSLYTPRCQDWIRTNSTVDKYMSTTLSMSIRFRIELGWHWMIWGVPCVGKSFKIFHFLSTTVTRSIGRDAPQRRRIDVGHRLKHLREHPSTPSSRRLLCHDRLFNIRREENELLRYLYTSDVQHLHHYGDLCFGLVLDYTPWSYRTDSKNGFLRKLGVKDTARIFTDLYQSDVEFDSSCESSSQERSPVDLWNHHN